MIPWLDRKRHAYLKSLPDRFIFSQENNAICLTSPGLVAFWQIKTNINKNKRKRRTYSCTISVNSFGPQTQMKSVLATVDGIKLANIVSSNRPVSPDHFSVGRDSAN